MATHFTYADTVDHESLHQGDLLRRTAELESLIATYHSYFAAKVDDYKFFAVLTQTCDLVRRAGGPCAARYVTLAAVRPATLVLERQLQQAQQSEAERRMGFVRDRELTKIELFLDKLLNNNEPDYFFYRQEPDFEIYEDYCAFLRLSIPLRAIEHYSTFCAAKIAQLSDSFQHKLGSLVGTSFSRVGTQDWDNAERIKQRNAMVSALGITRLQDKEHALVTAKLVGRQEEELTHELLRDLVSEVKREPQRRRQELLAAIAEELEKLNVDEGIRNKATARLRNNPVVVRYSGPV